MPKWSKMKTHIDKSESESVEDDEEYEDHEINEVPEVDWKLLQQRVSDRQGLDELSF